MHQVSPDKGCGGGGDIVRETVLWYSKIENSNSSGAIVAKSDETYATPNADLYVYMQVINKLNIISITKKN